MRIDHDLFLKSAKYRTAIRKRLSEFTEKRRGKLANLEVEHECDLSCCRREPWLLTLQRLHDLADNRWSSSGRVSAVQRERSAHAKGAK